MDARVDDFLNEINEIAPNKHKEQSISTNKSACDWEECFDETSGFSYYWNVNTNEVTWDIPSNFKKGKTSQKKLSKLLKPTEKHQIYKPESKIVSMVPVSQIPDTIIYKIGDTIAKRSDSSKGNENSVNTRPKIEPPKNVLDVNKKINDKRKLKRQQKSDDESEDEKITLISSYGGDTESEDEDCEENEDTSTQSKVIVPTRDTTKISKNASNSSSNAPLTDPPQKVTGIALLASYGESDDEEDTNKDKKVINFNAPPKISTLFPIQPAIDASQFDSSSNNQKTTSAKMTLATLTEEQRVYQRKRRIGLELPANISAKKTEKGLEITNSEVPLDGARTGFGFTASSAEKYLNFKSAGKISFVKSVTILPSNVTISSNDAELLKEKLDFLCEGKQVDVSPVQIMLIQLETLQTAKLAGCLQTTYLHKWLQETNEEISKLEKDSTPEGWLLEWDRGQKRYSYRHLHSRHVQWNYPAPGQPLANGEPVEEDMDICTTPPPPLATPPLPLSTPTAATTLASQLKEYQLLEDAAAIVEMQQELKAIEGDVVEEDVEEMEAPPPPKIGRLVCPVAPPPPILTEADMVTPPLPLPPAESPPPPPPPPEEPLPPGVENTPTNIQKTAVPLENFSTVLDSFYSDIAAMESSIIINNVPEDAQQGETSSITNAADVIPVESAKKRKKLKMSQGLSMKKKGVSKLVEKWKSVQKTLD